MDVPLAASVVAVPSHNRELMKEESHTACAPETSHIRLTEMKLGPSIRLAASVDRPLRTIALNGLR